MIENFEETILNAIKLLKQDKRRLYLNIKHFKLLLPYLDRKWDLLHGDTYYFKGIETKFDCTTPEDLAYIMKEEFAEELREREQGVVKDNPLFEFKPDNKALNELSRQRYLQGEWRK